MPEHGKNKTNKTTLQFWNKRLAAAKSVWEMHTERGRRIVERYRDDSPHDTHAPSRSQGGSIYNILYANTETLHPVLYSNTPIPDVRASTSKNDVPAVRESAIILETALAYNAKDNLDTVMNMAVQDYLLPGKGVVRVKYIPVIDKAEVRRRLNKGEEIPEGQEPDEEGMITFEDEEVIYEVVSQIYHTACGILQTLLLRYCSFCFSILCILSL